MRLGWILDKLGKFIDIFITSVIVVVRTIINTTFNGYLKKRQVIR